MVQVYTLLGEMSYFSLVTSVYRGIERKKKKSYGVRSWAFTCLNFKHCHCKNLFHREEKLFHGKRCLAAFLALLGIFCGFG